MKAKDARKIHIPATDVQALCVLIIDAWDPKSAFCGSLTSHGFPVINLRLVAAIPPGKESEICDLKPDNGIM